MTRNKNKNRSKSKGSQNPPNPKPSSPPPPPAAATTTEPVPEPNTPNYACIQEECRKAIFYVESMSPTPSNVRKKLKNLENRFPNSALVRRVQAVIYIAMAEPIRDVKFIKKHLGDAMVSAKKATELSPSSIESARLYARVMYTKADRTGTDYEEIKKGFDEAEMECERGLWIENPTDPAKERLDDRVKGVTVESVKTELRWLIQDVHLWLIQEWMKQCGCVDYMKYSLKRRYSRDEQERQIQEDAESSAGLNLGENRNVNEESSIESNTGADRNVNEERSIELNTGGNRNVNEDRSIESNTGDDRNVSAGEDVNVNEETSIESSAGGNDNVNVDSEGQERDPVSEYWDSLSYEKKKDFLSVRICDLKEHHQKDKQSCEVLSEALGFYERNKSWMYFACCHCKETFVDDFSLARHVIQTHVESLPCDLVADLPVNVDEKWADMLLGCSWKPLDFDAYVRALQGKSSSSEGNEKGEGSNMDGKVCDENPDPYCPDGWPSDDGVRGKLLEEVSSKIKALVERKCFAASHLQEVIEMTRNGLQRLPPDSELLECGIDQFSRCICLLENSVLTKIEQFLREISDARGVGIDTRKSSSSDASTQPQISEAETMKIVHSKGALCLVLDENLLSGDASGDNSGAARSENCAQSGSDYLLSWIYAGPSIGEQLSAWSRQREENAKQGREILDEFAEQSGDFLDLCGSKCKAVERKKALQVLEEFCSEENNSEKSNAPAGESYKSTLEKRRDEIQESDAVSNEFELKAIDKVLNAAGDLKSMDCLLQLDDCIKVAIQNKKEKSSIKLGKLEAKILQNLVPVMRKLVHVSNPDYHSLLLALVKSFMQARLEGLAKEDATEKSEDHVDVDLVELNDDGDRNENVDSEWMKKDLVGLYWDSLSYETKRDFLSVRVRDLQDHHQKDEQCCEVLLEAFGVYQAYNSWRSLACCRCQETFADANAHKQHVAKKHVGSLLPNLILVTPSIVDGNWAEMLLNCLWKPRDLDDFVRKLVNPLQPSDSASEGIVNDCKESNDPERVKLLENIGSMFKELVQHKCLADSLLQKVIQLTRKRLRVLPSGWELFKRGIDENPLCICFLGASDLTKVVNFLHQICDARKSSEDVSTQLQISELEDINIVLNEDGTCLLLDESLLSGDGSGDNYGSDSLLAWIHAGPSISERLPTWSNCRVEKAECGRVILDALENKGNDLWDSYEVKQALCWDSCEEKGALCQRRQKETACPGPEGFQLLEEHSFLEISKLDVRILGMLSKMQQLYSDLGTASTLDYRSVLFPLVKSYLQVRLEDLAGKAAGAETDVAGEELLSDGSSSKETRTHA